MWIRRSILGRQQAVHRAYSDAWQSELPVGMPGEAALQEELLTGESLVCYWARQRAAESPRKTQGGRERLVVLESSCE